MKEVVEEKELEITQFKDQQYARDHEEPTPWMFAMLAEEDLLLEPGMGAQASDVEFDDPNAPPPNSVFYPADEFRLFARQPITFPRYMKVSNNYFDKRWSGHRRVKNVIVQMEWTPDRDKVSLRAEPHAAPPLSRDLPRTLKLLAHTAESGTGNDARVTPKSLQQLIDVAFELSRTGRECDEITADGVSYRAADKLLSGPSIRSEREGLHSVCLSLVEAETIRRIMHVADGQEVVDSARVDLALRIVPAEDALMDSTFKSVPPPPFQRVVTHQAWRFFDCETHYSDPQIVYLLKAVQMNRDFERRCFFEQIIGCKRRDQKGWSKTPVARAFSLASEYTVIHLRTLSLRVRDRVRAKELLPYDAFQLMDYGKVGSLSPGNIYAGLKWLGLTPSHDDVLDFVAMAHPSGEGGVTYSEWLSMMIDPAPPLQHVAAPASSIAEELALIMARQDSSEHGGMTEARSNTDLFDNAPSSGAAMGGRQRSGVEMMLANQRIPPIDEEIFVRRDRQREALHEEMRRQHEQKQRDTARELTRAIRSYRRALQRKRGLDDNPSVNCGVLRWQFESGFMPDDVTFVGLTEFREEPDRKKALWAAHESMIVLPTGAYACDWLAMGGGLDSFVYQWTFMALVKIPGHNADAGYLGEDENGFGDTPLLCISRHLGPMAAQVNVSLDGHVVVEDAQAADIVVDTPVEWWYDGPSGWTPYDKEYQRGIERAYRENPGGQYPITVFSVGVITLNFSSMTQHNQATGGTRGIQRRQDVDGARVKRNVEHLVTVTVDAITGNIRTYVDGLASGRFKAQPHDGQTLMSPFTLAGDHPLFLFGHRDDRRMRGGSVRWCSIQPTLLSAVDIRDAFAQHKAFTQWVCAICTSRNVEDAVTCSVCDNPRVEAAPGSAAVTGAPVRDEGPRPWNCGCGYIGNPANQERCTFCTMERGVFPDPLDPVPSSSTRGAGSAPWRCGCGNAGNPAGSTECTFCGMPKGYRFD